LEHCCEIDKLFVKRNDTCKTSVHSNFAQVDVGIQKVRFQNLLVFGTPELREKALAAHERLRLTMPGLLGLMGRTDLRRCRIWRRTS